ncbi:hypothetical protein [Lentibacillus amyloliquefaciens]|uniref:Uncharacterized protein n=1 Tax=Lentibacillus amyloliquefaciens TaxID=1472767 RepID=A0A0U4F9D1_9BACI|nr:hypothetical protein [Lentibacillus amyloliquefaciens]ALX50214.1 hypothetical protein AOX59_17500 [Lentibacillus amyloliquefaciens]
MKNNDRFRQQVRNIQRETNSPNVINDVLGNEFEQYPGHNEDLTKESRFNSVEKTALNNLDGKTWSNTKK